MLGEGRAELLAAIERKHSITKAAKAVGISYRRAWTMIQEVNGAAGVTLVEAAVGGTQGGGARLTDRGRAAIEIYEQVRQLLVETAAGTLVKSVRHEDSAAACIHLSAAISLQEAIGQVLAEFALVEPAVRVRAIYGASNELADQLLAGAPGDLFVSAEPAEIRRLEAGKLVARGKQLTIARNGLAVIGASKSAPMKTPVDLLAARFRRVAVAEPACPLGGHTKAYLEKRGIYAKLMPKILSVDNSRAVLTAVASGAAQAGVAFSSDACGPGAWRLLYSVPTEEAATSYTAAIVGRNLKRVDVKSLYDFLTSPAAERCYRRCGLQPA